jgi:hypothetical protein
MSEEITENKKHKGLSETIRFCAVIDILLLVVFIFYNNLSRSFLAFVVPGFMVTLLFTFIICFFVSLVYAISFKKLSWKGFVPLLINTITIFSMIFLIQLNNR